MKLPDRFQMRHKNHKGMTHTVKKNANGDYEVTWARGYPEKVGFLPNKLFYDYQVETLVEQGYWEIVDDKPKQENLPDCSASLPDALYFKTKYNEVDLYALTKQDDGEYGCHNFGKDWDAKWNAKYSVEAINKTFAEGDWIRQDEPEMSVPGESASAKPAAQLPSQFYFEHADKTCGGKVVENTTRKGWDVTWNGNTASGFYSHHFIPYFIENGIWKILDKKPLTAEQQRALKEYKEQVSQIDASIRIQEQTVEHHLRMVANYEERQKVLRAKIAELEGA